MLVGLDEEVDGTWVSDERGGISGLPGNDSGCLKSEAGAGAPSLAEGSLRLTVSDDLSGIDRWEGRCNGRWMRFGWEKGVLVHPVADGILTEGAEVKVWAVDEVGNLGHREFTWPLK